MTGEEVIARMPADVCVEHIRDVWLVNTSDSRFGLRLAISGPTEIIHQLGTSTKTTIQRDLDVELLWAEAHAARKAILNHVKLTKALLQ